MKQSLSLSSSHQGDALKLLESKLESERDAHREALMALESQKRQVWVCPRSGIFAMHGHSRCRLHDKLHDQ
jgi:hypothetical protein